MYEMVKSGNADAVFDDYPVLAYGDFPKQRFEDRDSEGAAW